MPAETIDQVIQQLDDIIDWSKFWHLWLMAFKEISQKFGRF